MKIYLVWFTMGGDLDWDHHDELMGVYATEELAKQAVNKMQRNDSYLHRNNYIYTESVLRDSI